MNNAVFANTSGALTITQNVTAGTGRQRQLHDRQHRQRWHSWQRHQRAKSVDQFLLVDVEQRGKWRVRRFAHGAKRHGQVTAAMRPQALSRPIPLDTSTRPVMPRAVRPAQRLGSTSTGTNGGNANAMLSIIGGAAGGTFSNRATGGAGGTSTFGNGGAGGTAVVAGTAMGTAGGSINLNLNATGGTGGFSGGSSNALCRRRRRWKRNRRNRNRVQRVWARVAQRQSRGRSGRLECQQCRNHHRWGGCIGSVEQRHLGQHIRTTDFGSTGHRRRGRRWSEFGWRNRGRRGDYVEFFRRCIVAKRKRHCSRWGGRSRPGIVRWGRRRRRWCGLRKLCQHEYCRWCFGNGQCAGRRWRKRFELERRWRKRYSRRSDRL